jgi:hypothetical protein
MPPYVAGAGGLAPAGPGLTTATDAAYARLGSDYLVFAQFAAAKSQSTSLSKNVCV